MPGKSILSSIEASLYPENIICSSKGYNTSQRFIAQLDSIKTPIRDYIKKDLIEPEIKKGVGWTIGSIVNIGVISSSLLERNK